MALSQVWLVLRRNICNLIRLPAVDRPGNQWVFYSRNIVNLQAIGKRVEEISEACYLAILEGTIKEARWFRVFWGKILIVVYAKQRITNNSRKVKHAETRFKNNGYTLCSVVTATGRKHQIRIHAQSINCPLVGELYGKDERTYWSFALMDGGASG